MKINDTKEGCKTWFCKSAADQEITWQNQCRFGVLVESTVYIGLNIHLHEVLQAGFTLSLSPELSIIYPCMRVVPNFKWAWHAFRQLQPVLLAEGSAWGNSILLTEVMVWWQVAVKNLSSDWGGDASCFPQHLNLKDPQDGCHGNGAFWVLKKRLNHIHMRNVSGAAGCENRQLPQPADEKEQVFLPFFAIRNFQEASMVLSHKKFW